MTPERYNEIESDINSKLTEEEIAQGWHFCLEFDGMLALLGHEECCVCDSGIWEL